MDGGSIPPISTIGRCRTWTRRPPAQPGVFCVLGEGPRARFGAVVSSWAPPSALAYPCRFRHGNMRRSSSTLGEDAEHRVVEASVRGEGAAVPWAGFAGDRGESTPGLFDDRHEGREVVGLHVELARDVDESFCEQHVRPEIAVGAVAPHTTRRGRGVGRGSRRRATGRCSGSSAPHRTTARRPRRACDGLPGYMPDAASVSLRTSPRILGGALAELRRTTRSSTRPSRCAAHQRRPIAGAEATPTTGTPSIASEMRLPHTGTPRRKFAVPSMGSMIHCRVESPSAPNSSPKMPSAGRSAARRSRIARSTARSASVTNERSGFVRMSRSTARNLRERDGVGEVGEFEGEGEVVAVGQRSPDQAIRRDQRELRVPRITRLMRRCTP